MPTRGSQAVLQMLADAGVEYLFGNPGTTELPLIDELAGQARIRYVLGLQEVPVMAMADGYAQAGRRLGVVNLHISCGLGNAMGMLYNAWRSGSPLLVTAGQQDRRLAFEEPVLWSPLVDVARPWTKWAAEVQRVEDLPSAVRRAVQTALTPPTGPVFLSIPIDVQREVAALDTTPAAPLDPYVRPPGEALRRAADVLASAQNPVILAGSRVTEGDAIDELVAVAELLGAPVISEPATMHGRLPFPCHHPLYGQSLPLWSPDIRQRLAAYDAALVVGMDLLWLYIYGEPARAMPESLKLVHLDPDQRQLGKNYPLEVGLLGHPKPGLAELASALDAAMTADGRAAATERAQRHAAGHDAAREALRAKIDEQRADRPMTPSVLMDALARALPPDVAVVEEAVTTTNNIFERLGALADPRGYFAQRGWALGWGLGCAVGVKLAWPDRPVLAVIGEGAAMYGIQALWTAAHLRLPVAFVIANNAQYEILKSGALHIGLPQAQQGKFVGQDLVDPEIDFVMLAQSLGVEAARVTEPDELSDRVAKALAGDRPVLIDVPIRKGPPG